MAAMDTKPDNALSAPSYVRYPQLWTWFFTWTVKERISMDLNQAGKYSKMHKGLPRGAKGEKSSLGGLRGYAKIGQQPHNGIKQSLVENSMGRNSKKSLATPLGQAYTEYVVILAVLFGVGFGVASVFVGFDELRQMFFGYYASLANFLNLPCF